MQRTIVEERSKNIVIMDVFSKLIQERIIFIDGEIDDDLANGVIAQMLYLDSLNKTEPIHIYINSCGGSISSGFAIYDVSKIIKSPIRTVCVGLAASMAAILLLMGKERCGLRHSRVMLHQVSTMTYGNLKEVIITTEEAKKLQSEMYDIIKKETSLENIEQSLLFDKWFTAEEALKCGILTSIL